MEQENYIKISDVIEQNVKLCHTAHDYIMSIPNWIYYFLPNVVIVDFLTEYPNDWSDHIRAVHVNYINGANANVTIKFDDWYNNEDFTRNILLPTFRKIVDAKYIEYQNQVKENIIEQLKLNNEHLQKCIEENNQQIQKLQNKNYDSKV